MELSKKLKKSGFDLIDSPIRNHKTLQLWKKSGFNKIEVYYSSLYQAFSSNIVLNEISDNALSINSSDKNSYNFNFGITLLDDILKSLGLGALELSSEIKSGNKVSISYDKSISKIYDIGEIENYFSKADFLHSNRQLLENLLNNDIVIISGILYAQDLSVEVSTNFSLSQDLVTKITNVVDGKIKFEIANDHLLKMVSANNTPFPVAVKANKIVFDKNGFKKLELITDTKDWF